MNLTTPYGPRDEASALEGDLEFIGVDERRPQCAPGYVQFARNKRFRTGRCSTRFGYAILPWMRGNGLTPLTDIYGGAVFSDPNQSGEWILIAAEGKVWKTRPNATATEVPLPAGVTLTAATFKKFVQANSSIVLLRGLGVESLICFDLEQGFQSPPTRNAWDVTFDFATNYVGLEAHNMLALDAVRFTGAGVPSPLVAGTTYYVKTRVNADAFTVSATPDGDAIAWGASGETTVNAGVMEVLDGAATMPPAVDGFFHLNRLLLITGKDSCAISDIGDPLRYQPQLQSFRINEGDSHTLVTARPFNEDTVVFLKSGNVKKVNGVSGDLSAAAGPLNVTDAYGATAGSVAESGTDLYWLTSELRISSLRLTELNKEQSTNAALSDPLEPTFARINAAAAHKSRLVVQDGYLRVALPLDDAQIVSATSLIPTDAVWVQGLSGGGYTLTGLTAGTKYQYRQGASSISLTNGTEIYYGDVDFVAQTTSVSLLAASSASGTPVTDTVKAVLADLVNTGIAVYDFQRGAWCGTDEAAELTCVVDWLKFSYAGQQVLGFLGADGHLHLCDQGFEDERVESITPYVDVLVDFPALLLSGPDSVQVNGGTLVTTSITGGPWIVTSDPRTTLWTGGYNPAAPNVWTCPNATAEQIDYGVRFVSTNGVLPEVKINGAVATDGYAGEWALLDSHDVQQIVPVAIRDWVRTRAYRCQRGDFKRFQAVAAQVATWSPNYTVRTLTQGQGTLRGEENNAGVTRDRLKYFDTLERDDWTPSNENEDYHVPGREDYSFAESGAGILLGADGINFDAHQEYLHRTSVADRGLWAQLDLENADGRLELVACAMEAEAGEVLGGLSVN